jgi:two-component system response regulator YesN
LINVLIVDDEPLVREFMMSKVDWKQFGMQIVGEACHGLEGLSFLSNHEVDMVLADIKMPKMDGIEFISRAKKLHAGIIFIVLSLYSDFHLVRDAFKAGACDYILKEDINTPLFRKQMISLQKMIINNKRDINEQRRKEIKEYITGVKNLQNVIPEHKRITVFLLKVPGDSFVQLDRIATRLFSNTIVDGLLLAYFENEGEWILLFKDDDWAGEQARMGNYTRIASAISYEVDKLLNTNIFISISNAGIMKNASELYKNARESLYLKYYHKLGRPFFSCEFQYKDESINMAQIKKKIFDSIKCADFKNIGTTILENFLIKAKTQKYTKSYIVNCLSEMLSYTADRLHDLGIEVPYLDSDLKSTIEGFEFFEDLYSWFIEIHKLLYKSCTDCDNQRIVDAVKKIIDNEYGKGITLSWISKRLKVSRYTLSRNFSKATGMTISQYITDTRIRAAKNYLVNTNLRIRQICDKVGYSSTEHFSRYFKKNTGYSPAEFRNKGRQQIN